MEGIAGLIIELIAGAIGGNAAGAAAKKYSLGTTGNSIAGAIGGVILGQIMAAMGVGEPGMAAAEGAPAGGGLDIGALVGQVVGGGVGGGALTVIAGLVKGMMQK